MRGGKEGYGSEVPTDWVAWGAAMAFAGALLGLIGDAYHLYWGFLLDAERSELLATFAYRAHGVLLAIGYALIAFGLPWVFHATRIAVGPLARVGSTVAVVGTVLVAGDYWAESAVVPGVVSAQPTLADSDATGWHLVFVIAAFATLALGWILLAVASWRGAQLARWKVVLLGVGAAVAFTPFSGSNLLLLVAVGLVAMDAWRARAPMSEPAPPSA